MKSKTTILPHLIVFALGCFALCPRAQAVSPPPDGGYPGNNTAEGTNALLGLTSGTFNTAVGMSSLESDTVGSFNTANGAFALVSNTASENTATGAGSLFSNTTGGSNTANGALALESNTTGSFNTANGAFALLYNNASSNTANGFEALESNTTGFENTAVGAFALTNNIDGFQNTAVGYQALFSNNGPSGGNTAVGYQALFSNNGFKTILNTATGFQALYGNIFGIRNTADGDGALMNNTTGSFNIAMGDGAGLNQTTGSNNVYIGAGINGIAGESNTCRIASIFGQTAANGSAVFITSGNKLGTRTSSKRFKDEIKSMGNASEVILALRPVSFRYKKEIDPQGVPEFGLIAEEVERVNPALVIRDPQGKPYTVRYEQINAMLLNEFLKEHHKVEEQQATIAKLKSTVALQRTDFEAIAEQQQREIQTLATGFKEQAAQIQKVSAQLQLNKPAPQVVCLPAIALCEGENNP